MWVSHQSLLRVIVLLSLLPEKNVFVWYRGFHLNYHAVTAELARVYLYAGQSEKAYETAKLLIDINADKGYYKAVTSSYSGPMNIENGNIKDV